MSDFHYEIETINHYSFENFIVDGKSMQDGTPTPSEPVPIEVVEGRNLFSTPIAGWISGAADTFLQLSGIGGSKGTAFVAEIPTNTTFTISAKLFIGMNRFRIALFDADPRSGESFSPGHFSQVVNINDPTADRMYTFSSGSFTWVVLGLSTSASALNPNAQAQLETGSAATPYVAPGCIGLVVGNAATSISLQGNVLASLPDGTRDTVTVDGAGHVTIEKNVGERTFDGSENWSLSGGAKRVNNNGLRALTRKSSNNYTVMPILCNRFTPQTASQTYNGTVGVSIDTTGDIGFATGETLTVDGWKTWLETNPVTIYYPLATSQTTDLGYIDVSNLKDISEEIPISIISTLDPETTYSYINRPSYDVLNPYEDYNAPEYAYPPNHFGQEWETFDANNWNKTEMLDYTGQPESHAVYTVELCELMQSGAFDWKRPELDWSEAAYNTEQYERFCKYFEQRFMFREISMLPPLHWFTAFKRMMVYELMPKYKPLYAQVESGLAPLGENEYYKERHVSSAYPETLLSGNSDYISSGEDKEWERVKVDNAADALEAYRNGFRSVDAALGDELEVLFISMYTSYVNGL